MQAQEHVGGSLEICEHSALRSIGANRTQREYNLLTMRRGANINVPKVNIPTWAVTWNVGRKAAEGLNSETPNCCSPHSDSSMLFDHGVQLSSG
jgi:hypothetical protein